MTDPIEILLRHPLPLGEGRDLTGLRLRRPLAGDLRGIKLALLLQMDTDALAQVVERVSEPLLPAARFWALDPEDLTEVAMAVVGFFAPASPSPPA